MGGLFVPVESVGGFGPEGVWVGEGGGVGGLLGMWRHCRGCLDGGEEKREYEGVELELWMELDGIGEWGIVV